jgi:choline transport protein
MKKQFSTVATLGVAFSILNSWVGAAGSLLAPISLGGSVTVIWGCLAGAIFTSTLCMGVIEMASAMPGAGGPYHYTFILADEKYRKFLV